MEKISTFNGDYFQKVGWFFKPQYWWVRHLLFWSFRYSDIILGQAGILDDADIGPKEFLINYLIPEFALVYFILLIAIPFLLLKNKVGRFTAMAILAIIVYSFYIFHYSLGLNIETLRENLTDYVNIYLWDGILLVGLITGLRVLLEYISYQGQLAEIQSSKLEAELAYLKSQVSPHFLFNTLNGISVLSEKYPEKVTSVIIKLSKVLRYQIYEGEKEFVMLRNEIEHLRNYLALEGMRQSNAQTNIKVTGNSDYHLVAPMMFLPFVENAVKHGRDTQGNAQIDIFFDTRPEKVIFTIQNNIPASPVLYESGGIGLKNIRRRLELLYPEKYDLTITSENNIYFVKLELDLLQPEELN